MKSLRYQHWFPGLLVIYEILIYLSMDAYAPALPKIAHALSTSVSSMQLTATVWFLSGLILQFFFAPLSDRYGRRNTLLIGGVIYIVSTALCALAPNIHMLLIARFFQGMAMPTMFISGYAAINECYETTAAVEILARMSSVTILAPAFGPLLGSAILMIADWRWIFVLLALLSIVVVLFLFFAMPETLAEDKRQLINAKQIIQNYFSVLKNFKFISLSLTTFLPIIGLIVWILAGPFIVVHLFHYNVAIFAVIQAIIFIFFIIRTKVISRFADPRYFSRLVNIGLGSVIFGAIFLTVVGYFFATQIIAMVIAMCFLTFGSGMVMPILSRKALDTSDAPMGIRITIFSAIRIGSGIVGSLCVVWFYNGQISSMAIITIAFTFLALLFHLASKK